MKSNSTIKEKIIDRTIHLIGEKGTTDVTVREIACAAGVNVAAVNYHFSSKEQMMALMEEQFIGGFAEVLNILFDEKLDPEQRLFAWANEAMFYLMSYPGIIILVNNKVNAEQPDSFGRSLDRMLKKNYRELKSLLGKVLNTRDEEVLNFKTTIFTSSIIQPVSFFEGSTYDRAYLRNEATRKNFLHLLLDSLKK